MNIVQKARQNRLNALQASGIAVTNIFAETAPRPGTPRPDLLA